LGRIIGKKKEEKKQEVEKEMSLALI